MYSASGGIVDKMAIVASAQIKSGGEIKADLGAEIKVYFRAEIKSLFRGYRNVSYMPGNRSFNWVVK